MPVCEIDKWMRPTITTAFTMSDLAELFASEAMSCSKQQVSRMSRV